MKEILETKFGRCVTGFLTSTMILLNIGCGHYEKFSEFADFNRDGIKDKVYVEASRSAPFGSKYDEIFLQIGNSDGTFAEPKVVRRVKGRIRYFDVLEEGGTNYLAVTFRESFNKDKRYLLRNDGKGNFEAIVVSDTL